MSAGPVDTVARKVIYKVVQRVVYNDANSFEFTLNPISFPFKGLCKISLTTIFGSNFTKGPDSIVVRLDVSQPFSQSNFLSTATVPQYNPNQVIYGSVLDKNAEQFGDTDLVNCHIFAHLTAGTKVKITVTDNAGAAFSGSFTGMLMFDIDPVTGL